MIDTIVTWFVCAEGESFKLRLSSWQASLVVSGFLVVFSNRSFWQEITRVVPPVAGNIFFLTTLLLFLVLFLQLFLFIVSFDYVFKPVVIFLLMTASLAAYFMDTFGVMIDRGMVQNVVETDAHEVQDLLSLSLFGYLFFLGIVPSWLVWRIELQYQSWGKEVVRRGILFCLSLVIMVGIIFASYGDFIDLGKNHKYVRHMINPINYLYGVGSYTSRRLKAGNTTMTPVGSDAKLVAARTDGQKKNLFIFVLGETARAKNFSLNGYSRQTNPQLSQEDIFNFTDFYSCGTATALSLPCMFSPLGRLDFRASKAKHSEGLLDVLSHVGVNVLWRDNQSGCKGTCDRVPHENMRNVQVEGLCNEGNCYDMVLLEGLQNHIDRIKEGDFFIVLHQIGSHGPAYFRRYPKEFARFTPECTSSQLQLCTQEEVANSYDNSILYTDYFLSEVIGFLKKNEEKYNTAMLYVSDHGESLGEHNIYLHGMPYMIAPDDQKHVPCVAWFSDSFMQNAGLQRKDLEQRKDEALSHDIIFHTVLGAMGVKTKVYKPDLDLLATCRE
jgi:lipid A ethanolaminephosphotransferase